MPDDSKPAPLAIRQQYSLAPTNFDEALRFADLVASSDFAPKDYRNKPGNVLVAVQMGAELGLAPMQALQNIAVINGRPSVWGDAMLALCQAHADFEDIEESDTGSEATCTVKRRGRTPTVRKFSMVDAKAAGLVGKQGPWSSYPARMRQMRARGFALRDAFADVLRGLNSAEESADLPIDATPRAPTPPARRVAPPVDKPKAIDTTGEPVSDDFHYEITFGKNKGKRLGELANQQLHWYAEEYKGTDALLKGKARAVIDARKAATKAASEQAAKDAGDNPDWGMTDAPVFASGIEWEGAAEWTGKPLADAELEALLRYELAVHDLAEDADLPDTEADLRRFEREAGAAIAAKEPPA